MRKMAAAIVIEDGKILLIHNNKHNCLRIEPPGGKKEDDETVEECVIREVKEELNVDIEILDLFGVYETDSREGDFEVSMFLSKIVGGELKLLEEQIHSGYGWYEYNDLFEFKEKGFLVPNLVSSLEALKSLFV